MATTDAKVSVLVDSHITSTHNNEESDPDALFASLEAEDDSAFRAQRAQQLSVELAKLRPNHIASVTADLYKTLHSDDEVLRFTTAHEKTVVHFSHAEFNRCSVMDAHLKMIAEAHGKFDGSEDGEVRFAKVDVKDASFVVEKLGVRVLPCVVAFLEGVAKGRVVGFEGLGVWMGGGVKEDGMEVCRALEARLVEWALLGRRLLVNGADGLDEKSDEDEEEVKEKWRDARRGIQGRKQKPIDDDDDEWD